MNNKITMISILLGLGLINPTVQASGLTSKGANSIMSSKSETLSQVIHTLTNKENLGTKATSAVLTISIIENFQSKNQNYLKTSKEEKVIFNSTVKSIISQADNISDINTLIMLKEIYLSAKAINVVWAVVAEKRNIDTNVIELTQSHPDIIVVF